VESAETVAGRIRGALEFAPAEGAALVRREL